MPADRLGPGCNHVLIVVIFDALGQDIGWNHRKFNLGHDPEQAKRDLRRVQKVGLPVVDPEDLALAGHEAQSRNDAREASLREPGAMSARGDDSRNGLRIDIALIVKG